MMNWTFGKRTWQRKWTMNFATWNIQGIRNKQQEILQDCLKRKIDIIVLSETKKKGNGNEKLREYMHFYSGVDKDQRAKAGVSILIHEKYRKKIKSWEPISERFIKMTLYIRGRYITIIGIYALNDDATVQAKDVFEGNLREVIDNIPHGHEVVLAGDLNARVGQQRSSKVVGVHGEETINNNGERLINICEEYELKIMNTFFAHKDIHKYTWYQHTRGLRSIIDYFILKQKTGLKVIDTRVIRGAECGSDHRLVSARIYIPFIGVAPRSKQGDTTRTEDVNYHLDSLQHDSTRKLYAWRLDRKLTVVNRSTEEEYQHIKNCIKEAAEEALGRKLERVDKPFWWDSNIEEKIERKKELYQRLLQTGNDEIRAEYKRMNREVKQQVVKKKNDTWERKCQYVEDHVGGTKSSKAWKTIKNIKSTCQTQIHLNNIPDRQWVQHFKELLTETRDTFNISDEPIQVTEPITLYIKEVEKAIKDTKLRKSPGPGGINPELIRYGPPKLTEMLRTLFERCLNGEDVPREWRTSYITPIYKKGSKSDPKNYRGIAVIPTLGRLYSRLLKILVEENIQNKQPEEQAGFRAGRSTIDNIFTVKIATEKRVQRNRETHIASIDLEKAYDSVPVSQLWRTMKSLNISTNIIRATKMYYEQNTATIKLGNRLTTSFQTTKGLRQGCCLSPTLFKIYLDRSLIRWTKKCKNMGLRVGEDSLFTLYFADDQIILAEDQEDLSYMVRKLKEEYELAGLTMNMAKCEYLVVGNEGIENLTLENESIRGVEKSKYLGVTLNKHGNSKDEITERINKGRSATRALNSLLWDKNITKRTKKRIYESMVQSITLYGSEVWDVSYQNKKKLTATEMDFYRRSCGWSRLDRVRNDIIRTEMNVSRPITEEIERRQLVWFGHVKRMTDDRWPKKVLEWVPPERRKRGRPRRSWRDDVEEAMTTRNLEEDTCFERKNWKLGTERRRQL